MHRESRSSSGKISSYGTGSNDAHDPTMINLLSGLEIVEQVSEKHRGLLKRQSSAITEIDLALWRILL
jgi:hypothetical protein